MRGRQLISTLRSVAGPALVSLALLGVLYPVWWQHRSASEGAQLVQTALREPAIRKGPPGQPRPCKPVKVGSRQHPGVIEIPAIGLRAPVLQGVGDPVLAVSVGHYPSSPWPGAKGLSELLAHDVSWFSHLGSVKAGDRVEWIGSCTEAIYRVTAKRVLSPGSPFSAPTNGTALITCWPSDALYWTQQRLVVTAKLVKIEKRFGATANLRPGDSTGLRLRIPKALAAQGLSLAQAGILVGTLKTEGHPSSSWAESGRPLAVANEALRLYAAAWRTTQERHTAWWRAIALPRAVMPRRAWSLAYDTNVAVLVWGSRVHTITLTSPAVRVILVNRRGELVVRSVRS